MRAFLVVFISIMIALPELATAQGKDSLIVRESGVVSMKADTGKPAKAAPKKIDSLKKTDTVKRHSPRKAALRSAIIPGWGQIYNKKYWKVPIVYAAVGIPAYLYVDNKRWYDRTRYALAVVANKSYNNPDSMAKVHSRLKPLVDLRSENSLLNYRNEFRKNMDYSILFGLLFWGLNIVDATVDAHLKGFNVNDDISLRVKPTLIPISNSPGVSFVFTIGKTQPKTLPSLR